jgi:signal transduction histidine kinase
MKKRSILTYWLLMLLPTVFICLAAARLLVHEQERISQMGRASRTERLQNIAETLQITVDAVEVELQQALYDIPEERLAATLLEWEATNPLIRNVFVWHDNATLEYPLPGLASTAEERQFMERFDGLFAGRISFSSDETSDESGLEDGMEDNADASSSLKTNVAEKMASSRQALVDLVRISEQAATPDAGTADEFARQGGWIPWFVENRLYILGWVKADPDGPVYGVELELMSLLSRLITDFPADETDGVVYTLTDDSGRVLHQTGAALIDPDTDSESVISLAPQLPHWELADYAPGEAATPLAGRGFLILSGLLLFIFLAAIISGSGMLTWQAHRNQKEALEKTSFVSNVSHELKTPLTSIRMYAELLFSGRIYDPDKKQRYLQVIVSEARRLTRLVNNVLDFSRLEQGKKNYHSEKIHLVDHIQEVLAAHALPVKEAGMVLTTSIPDREITVYADRDAIDQVMVNLLDNAVKYAAGGGELKVSLGAEKEQAWIEIADKGPGVSPAHRERIFEQFHRVDDSLTAKQQGSGLGLSIARRILRDLGGDLVYRPGKSGGSCFVFYLPLAGETATPLT